MKTLHAVALAVGLALAPVLPAAPKVVVVHPVAFENAKADEAEIFAELVRTELGNRDDLAVVDRARLQAALGELAISGANTDGGARLGGILGADYLAEARVAELDGQRLALVKVVDVASTRSRGLHAPLAPDASRFDAAALVAEKLTELLARFGHDAAPAPELPVIAPLPSDARRPVVAVRIPEEVLASPVPDPAAELRTVSLLLEHGFRVVDIATAHAGLVIDDGTALRASGRRGFFLSPAPVEGRVADDSPLMEAVRVARARGVEVLVYGEGFAEAGARLGNLATSRARVEIRAVDTRSGDVIFSRSASAGAGDASPAVAAKAALEKAAHHVAAKLIPSLASRPAPATGPEAAAR
jgi:hypothetical protein